MGSNPTPDSTLIYLPMDRKLRRELSKRKWISRAKKVYNSCGKFYIPVNGIKASVQYNVPIFRNRALIFLMIPSMPKCLRIALLPTEVR